MRWQDHRYAPQPGISLCEIDAVPDGACMELRYGQGDAAFGLLLYRKGLEVHAYVNRCPHFSLPLNSRPNEFLLLPDGCLMCAYHSTVFRLDDGHCIDGPAVGLGLDRVPVQLIGAEVILGAE